MYKKILLLTMIPLSLYSGQNEKDEADKKLYNQHKFDIICAQNIQTRIIKRKNEFKDKKRTLPIGDWTKRCLNDLFELYASYEVQYNILKKLNYPNFFEGLQSIEDLCEYFDLITKPNCNPDQIRFK